MVSPSTQRKLVIHQPVLDKQHKNPNIMIDPGRLRSVKSFPFLRSVFFVAARADDEIKKDMPKHVQLLESFV